MAIGLAALLHTSATAFLVIKYLGVAYLFYMTWKIARAGGALDIGTKTTPQSSGRIALSGMLINMLNPKISLFFLVFLPQFVPAGPGPRRSSHWLPPLWASPLSCSSATALSRLSCANISSPALRCWHGCAAPLAAFLVCPGPSWPYQTNVDTPLPLRQKPCHVSYQKHYLPFGRPRAAG